MCKSHIWLWKIPDYTTKKKELDLIKNDSSYNNNLLSILRPLTWHEGQVL